jgi:hypothetical protein
MDDRPFAGAPYGRSRPTAPGWIQLILELSSSALYEACAPDTDANLRMCSEVYQLLLFELAAATSTERGGWHGGLGCGSHSLIVHPLALAGEISDQAFVGWRYRITAEVGTGGSSADLEAHGVPSVTR